MESEEKISIHTNIEIKGANDKPMLVDIFLPKGNARYPLLVFAHGFKGFKDWGHFNYMAAYFASYGIACVKFNFSHNGIQNNHPQELSDPALFGDNNYSKELLDIRKVLDFLSDCEWKNSLEIGNITMVGHSRGGAMAFLAAIDDVRIKKLVMWAAQFDLQKSFKKESIEQWEKDGVVQVFNKRTQSHFPLYKQFYDDFLANKKRLNIPELCYKFPKPLLILHGDKDETVPFQDALSYYDKIPHAILIKQENQGHTFGAQHPFSPDNNPNLTSIHEVLENTAEFVLDSFAW
jgi:pimeloyl-ACP methyl ester carboxylesterase